MDCVYGRAVFTERMGARFRSQLLIYINWFAGSIPVASWMNDNHDEIRSEHAYV